MSLLFFLLAQPVSAPSGRDTEPVITETDTTFKDTLKAGVSTVEFEADTVIFYADTKEVLLLHNAEVRYGEIKVYSDSIRFSTRKKQLSAYKNVRFFSGRDSVIGSWMRYDVETKKGCMEDGHTQIEKGFFYGQGIWLVEENTLHITNGYYTTCAHEKPHYDFFGFELKVFLNDMVIARPLLFRLGKLPVLAAPFWYVPIGSERKSGLLPFQLSYNSTEGFYLKKARYYWAANDYMDALFSADIMTRTGIKPGLNVNWAWGPKAAEYLSGSFIGSYINELETGRRRWEIHLADMTKIPDGTSISADINFKSDGTFSYDYLDNPDSTPVVLDQTSTSNVSISRSIFTRPVSIAASRTDSLNDSTYTMTLPSLNLSWPTLNLWEIFSLSFGSFSLSNSYNHGKRWIVDTLSGDSSRYWFDERKTSFDQPLSLSWAYTFFGAYTFSQSWSAGQNLTLTQDTLIRGGNYSLNNSLGTTLYRLFGVNTLGMKGLLHSVSPSINYSITPKVGQIYPWLAYPRFDTIFAGHSVSLSVSQSFQTKLRSKTDTTSFTKQTLLNLGTDISYNLLSDSLSPVSASISLPGGLPLTASGGASFNVYNGNYSLNADLTAQLDRIIFPLIGIKPKEENHDTTQDTTIRDTTSQFTTVKPDTLEKETFGQRFAKSTFYIRYNWGLQSVNGNIIPEDNMLAFNTSIYLPLEFQINFQTQANFSENKKYWYQYLLAPHLSVIKGLHCWEAAIEIGPKSGTITLDPADLDWSFYLRIKELPDFEISTKLFKSLTGSGG